MTDVQAFRFEDDGETPNNPRLPLLVYRAAFVAGAREGSRGAVRACFCRAWLGRWLAQRHLSLPALPYGTHEVLGIARGRATVEFGGAKGRKLGVEAGDVVVLPAGTGHRRIEASGDLLVVGAYPLNGSLDQKRPGEIEHHKAVSNVANVPLPEMDPVHGACGAADGAVEVGCWGRATPVARLRQPGPRASSALMSEPEARVGRS